MIGQRESDVDTSRCGTCGRQIRSTRRPGRTTVTLILSLQLILILASCCAVLGCSGCLKKDTDQAKNEKDKKKKKKNPKADFEFSRPKIEPSDETTGQAFHVKPGHWITVSQKIKANNFNFSGELHSASTNGMGRRLRLEKLSFCMTANRPVALPKGQSKIFDMLYFVPRRQHENARNPWLEVALKTKRGRREHQRQQEPTSEMRPFHFFFVVIAANSDAYRKLANIDSVKPPPKFDLDQSGSNVYYRMKFPKTDKRLPLPTHALTWTSIAHVLWDNVDPNPLSSRQRQALVDWLHYGGQLIVSGPGSLDTLRSSFLKPYLPCVDVTLTKLDQDNFRELNECWGSRRGLRSRAEPIQIEPGMTLDAVELKLVKGASYVPRTGGLVAEQRVGRGRIVVTSFPLSHRRIINWKRFDEFFNACLLRRPARIYTDDGQGDIIVRWADYKSHRDDPRLISRLRYFTRDANDVGVASRNGRSADPDPEFHYSQDSGVAGWSDFSAAAVAARNSLKKSAGIVIPEPTFVLKVVAIYLFVLVPVNWCFFRVLGRTEWAWAAVPVVAVVCAVVVVRLAELNIGFARSRTEIGVLEMQGGFSRGHLTRYTALYSSLSSSYELSFDDESALAQPFAKSNEEPNLFGKKPDVVSLGREKKIRFHGFKVQSNSTGMVHSEQMVGLGGPIRLRDDVAGAWELSNESDLVLNGVGIVRKAADDRAEIAWIDKLESKTTAVLQFKATDNNDGRPSQWAKSPVTRQQSPPGEVSLRRLFEIAWQPSLLRPGDVRLVAWTDDDVPGLSIRPKASQTTVRTMILTHLRYAPLPEPRPDVNSSSDVTAAIFDESGHLAGHPGQSRAGDDGARFAPVP